MFKWIFSFILTNLAYGSIDLQKAPPSFMFEGKTVVFVDIQNSHLELTFDLNSQKVLAQSTVEFMMTEKGSPVLDFAGSISNLEVNGQTSNIQLFKSIQDPDKVSKFTIVNQELPAGTHKVSITYELKNENISVTKNYARAGFFMSDLTEPFYGLTRNFMESYALSNFEYDQYKQTINLKVVNTEIEHILIANGNIKVNSKNNWSIDFADYFTTSSFYLHLFEKGHFTVVSETFSGKAKEFPLIIYGKDKTLIESALDSARAVLTENEETFGEYLHDTAIAYMTPSGGGMEHCGATITSMLALEHEFTHFWFARGVMPIDGNSGWVDEAIASWRDEGYKTGNGNSVSAPVKMSGFSPYKRNTSILAYSEGEYLLRDLDYYLKKENSSLKSLLRGFFELNKAKTIHVNDFQNYLDENSNFDVSGLFKKFVYGMGNSPDIFSPFEKIQHNTQAKRASKYHPRPFTKEELRKLL